MACVARIAQVANDVVAIEIYRKSGCKDCQSGDELRGEEPIGGVHILGSYIENPAALHQRVEQIESDTRQDYGKRHSAFSLDKQREDERTLEIVQLKHCKEDERHHGSASVRIPPQQTHSDEHRSLHKHPAELVVHRWSPPFGVHNAISGIDEVQCYIHHYCHCHHHGKQRVEMFRYKKV